MKLELTVDGFRAAPTEIQTLIDDWLDTVGLGDRCIRLIELVDEGRALVHVFVGVRRGYVLDARCDIVVREAGLVECDECEFWSDAFVLTARLPRTEPLPSAVIEFMSRLALHQKGPHAA